MLGFGHRPNYPEFTLPIRIKFGTLKLSSWNFNDDSFPSWCIAATIISYYLRLHILSSLSSPEIYIYVIDCGIYPENYFSLVQILFQIGFSAMSCTVSIKNFQPLKKQKKTDFSVFSALSSFLIQKYSRGRRTRTLGTWFWRPLLYHLSYTPIWIMFRIFIIPCQLL